MVTPVQTATRTTQQDPAEQPRTHAAGAGRGNGQRPLCISYPPSDGGEPEAHRIRSRIDALLHMTDQSHRSTLRRAEYLTGGMYVFEKDEEDLSDWPTLQNLENEVEELEEPDTLPLVAQSRNAAHVLLLSSLEGGIACL